MTTSALPTTKIHPPITVAGRTFVQATSTTVDQDAYVMKRYRGSALAEMVRAFNPATDDLTALSERLLWEALDSGAMYEILGGILIEPGVPWSRAGAAATAALFRGLTDDADKAVVYTRMSDVLFDFLVIAALSGHPTGSSSVTNPRIRETPTGATASPADTLVDSPVDSLIDTASHVPALT